MEYTEDIQVRFSDFDSQCLVNHAVICTYIELAYTLFAENELNPEWNAGFMPLVLKTSQTDYRIAIRPGARPYCTLNVSKIRGADFTMEIQVRDRKKPGVLYCQARRQLAYIDLQHQKPLKFGGEITNKLLMFYT